MLYNHKQTVFLTVQLENQTHFCSTIYFAPLNRRMRTTTTLLPFPMLLAVVVVVAAMRTDGRFVDGVAQSSRAT